MARVLISMPESFLGKIDEVAENESRSRSELIREALRSYITRSQVRNNTLADKNARILEALLEGQLILPLEGDLVKTRGKTEYRITHQNKNNHGNSSARIPFFYVQFGW